MTPSRVVERWPDGKDTVTDRSLQEAAGPTASFSLQRTSLGLIFRDQFNRADSATVGNDWIPNDPANTDIQDNKLRVLGGSGPTTASFFTGSTTAERFPTGGLLDLPTKYMVQTNHAFDTSAGARVVTLTRADSVFRTGSFSSYEAFTEKSEEAFHKIDTRIPGGGAPFAQGPGLSLISGSFYGARLILEDLGGDTAAISGAWTAELSSSTDLSAPFTSEILTFTHNPQLPETNIVGIGTQDDEFADEFIIQGIEVVVTNLPTGFSASIDADTAVVESGGTVTFNVRTRALPYATMSVFGVTGSVVDQVFPQSASLSDGWGGDTYAFTEV